METEKLEKLENSRTAKFADRNGISIFAPCNSNKWNFPCIPPDSFDYLTDCKDNLSGKIEKQYKIPKERIMNEN